MQPLQKSNLIIRLIVLLLKEPILFSTLLLLFHSRITFSGGRAREENDIFQKIQKIA